MDSFFPPLSSFVDYSSAFLPYKEKKKEITEKLVFISHVARVPQIQSFALGFFVTSPHMTVSSDANVAVTWVGSKNSMLTHH